MSKEAMIKEILIAAKAGGAYMGGDLFFGLAFRTEAELRKICQELNINCEVKS